MANDWIMVVDDDAFNLQNAGDILRDSGMRVSAARSGAALLKFMEKHCPDLILLDIMMPEMDGFEAYRQLRELEAHLGRRPTPVIFLTGENDSATEQRGLTMGASDYIRKPFDQDILLRRIYNTINNNRTIESLTEEATRDKLTGFLNKAGTGSQMTVICLAETGMLMILDLDSFKLVNDIYGHDMGDRVLTTFADLVRSCTRGEDVLCRIGGDEFLIFCRNAGPETAKALSGRLNEQLTAACRKMMGEDFGIPIGVSIGAVAVPEHGREYQTLFSLADKTLYQVKQNGKHGYAVYSEATDEASAEETPDRALAKLTVILEERGEARHALWLGQDAFAGAYRFLVHGLKQSGGTASRILFSITPKDGQDPESKVAEGFTDLLNEVLGLKDAVLQSRPTQFFVLLPGADEGEAECLAEDVRTRFWEAPWATGYDLKYAVDTSVYVPSK